MERRDGLDPEASALATTRETGPAARAYVARVLSFAILPAKNSTNFPTATGPAAREIEPLTTVVRESATSAEQEFEVAWRGGDGLLDQMPDPEPIDGRARPSTGTSW